MIIRAIKNRLVGPLKIYFKDILLNSVSASCWCPRRLRNWIYSSFGHKIVGIVQPKCFLGYGHGRLFVGEKSRVNYSCFFDLGDDITIGEGSEVSFNVKFINSSHLVGDKYHRAGEVVHMPIVIGRGCWIGANVTIMPGVTIGDGCVIGAGSLVTNDCEPNGVYVGIPARRKKELE